MRPKKGVRPWLTDACKEDLFTLDVEAGWNRYGEQYRNWRMAFVWAKTTEARRQPKE